MRYLFVTFFRKPGGQVDEQVGFAKKIRPSDQNTCNIILDYAEKKVLKSIVNGSKLESTFEAMNAYYKEIYPELIAELEKIQNETKTDSR